jgi:hypothetical protein
LRQRGPEEFSNAKQINDLLFATAMPIQHEAVVQFALRKTIRKTVTPGKISAMPADSSQAGPLKSPDQYCKHRPQS